jgi:hypothetical protein
LTVGSLFSTRALNPNYDEEQKQQQLQD